MFAFRLPEARVQHIAGLRLKNWRSILQIMLRSEERRQPSFRGLEIICARLSTLLVQKAQRTVPYASCSGVTPTRSRLRHAGKGAIALTCTLRLPSTNDLFIPAASHSTDAPDGMSLAFPSCPPSLRSSPQCAPRQARTRSYLWLESRYCHL